MNILVYSKDQQLLDSFDFDAWITESEAEWDKHYGEHKEYHDLDCFLCESRLAQQTVGSFRFGESD